MFIKTRLLLSFESFYSYFKIELDFIFIDGEKGHYKELPKYFNFGNEGKKREFLLKNREKIYGL